MGLLGRIFNRVARTGAQHRGARLEAEGRLEEAYEAHLNAGQLADAARVMLARAEAEADPAKRIALLQLAASRAPGDSDLSQIARRRASLLRLHLVRAAKTMAPSSELIVLARELESLNLPREAGEAYGLADDTENQTRVLVACGAIDALESALESDRRERLEKRVREQTWKEIRDLDAIGRRLVCLRRCEHWLYEHPRDEAVAAFARSVREKIVRRGPIPLILQGKRVDLVVDHPLTIGRADASVVLPSPILGRQHLAVRRADGGVTVEDLGSRNGTWLAGARIDAPLPIGEGLDIRLGGQIPCKLDPWLEGGVRVTLPSLTIVAPLGPLRVRGFEIAAGQEGVFQLRSGTPPVVNGLTAEPVIELSYGDRIQEQRDGPVVIEVVSP